MKEFESTLSAQEIEARILEGIKDADEGRAKSWEEVEAKLMKKISSNINTI